MRGKVLLGWLAEADAIRYLREECIFDPPLGEDQARAMWEEKKANVDALGRRPVASPPHLEMDQYERQAARKFLTNHRLRKGNPIRDIVKLDPMGLVAWQMDINVDVADAYAADQTKNWCARNCLAYDRPRAQLPTRAAQGEWDFQLPHAEFTFITDGNVFVINQGLPHVGVSDLGNRTVLWTGYHRCCARVAMADPDGKDRTVLAALTTEGNAAFGPGSSNPTLRDVVLGECPPFLADFFDECLFMGVELRRRRYEMRVRWSVARIDV